MGGRNLSFKSNCIWAINRRENLKCKVKFHVEHEWEGET